VVSASDDKTTVRIWELKAGQSIGILRGRSDGVTAVAITPDGGRAISASDDKTPRVWELETGQELVLLTGDAAVFCCAVSSPPDPRKTPSDCATSCRGCSHSLPFPGCECSRRLLRVAPSLSQRYGRKEEPEDALFQMLSYPTSFDRIASVFPVRYFARIMLRIHILLYFDLPCCSLSVPISCAASSLLEHTAY
jgi:hypothetical protein